MLLVSSIIATMTELSSPLPFVCLDMFPLSDADVKEIYEEIDNIRK